MLRAPDPQCSTPRRLHLTGAEEKEGSQGIRRLSRSSSPLGGYTDPRSWLLRPTAHSSLSVSCMCKYMGLIRDFGPWTNGVAARIYKLERRGRGVRWIVAYIGRCSPPSRKTFVRRGRGGPVVSPQRPSCPPAHRLRMLHPSARRRGLVDDGHSAGERYGSTSHSAGRWCRSRLTLSK